jgi:DNA-binding MarR family transcriptional regulator
VTTKQVLKAVMTSTLDKESRHIMHVLAFVADYQTSELPPRFTPSTAQLARQTGMSESTVIRRRATLEAAGWITVKRPTAEESARRVRIRYWLTIPATGAHRAHAEAEQALIQGLADTPPAETPPDSGYLADTPTGFTVNPPDDSPWLPTGVPQLPLRVSQGHPEPSTGVPGTPQRVAGGHPDGWLGDTPKEPPFQQDLQKPPAAAGDREQRLAIAEELIEAFWAKHGTASAQRRPAVRTVIITAVADNAVPRNAVAAALHILATAGQQITSDSLTKALARIRGNDPARAAPDAAPARPPRRFCSIRDHAAVELTESGLCPNCAADARVGHRDPDEPPPHIPPPRRAQHEPQNDNTLTWNRDTA